jgi:hypothetical protein
MTDGLDALTQQREKAKTSARTMPQPRRAPRAAPDLPTASAEPGPPAPQTAESRPTAPATSGELKEDSTRDDLTRSSIYIDAAGDEFLEAVRAAGRRSKPKVDASRSAVVRLALSKLADDLSAEQVIAELRTRASSTTQTIGRKRL